MAPSRALLTVRVDLCLHVKRLSASAVRLEAAHFSFRVAAAWHGKPASPSPRKKPRSLSASSPIARWRDELLSTSQVKRTLGDDALFWTPTSDGLVTGVADGVGGWSEQGVDPSIFSTALMYHAQRLAERWRVSQSEELDASPDADVYSDPRQLLDAAYKQVLQDDGIAAGSSTACIARFDGNGSMQVANLGDSSFFIVRGGKTVYEQPAQTHYFNCPLQLAKGGGSDSYSDLPLSADLVEAQLQHNDIVLLATDGFTDNVFPNELDQLVHLTMPDGEDAEKLQQLANTACEYARLCSFKADRRSPFTVEAEKHGYSYLGGKVDDVTVLAVLCQES